MKCAMLSGALVLVCAGSAFGQVETSVPQAGVIIPPTLVKEVKPTYPAEALAAALSGTVQLECVVNEDGTVRDVRVIKALEPSFDAEAINALKQWQFKPGTRDGKPVPVLVTIEMVFASRPRGPRLGSPEVLKIGGDVTAPRVLEETKPVYPAEVMREGVQGSVEIECVVLTDGTVGDMRVVKSLHPRLDVEAKKAVSQWRFEPGTRDAKPVPVQVTLEMTFTVR